jgi:hypothetical protein
MLSGRETVPAAFAATVWREGWSELAERVRHLALGMGDVGTVPAPTTTAGALAVLSVGGTIDFDLAEVPLFEDALVDAGREIDRDDPDAFERRWRAVAPGDVAARGDAGQAWTHGSLLWAARSFAQGVDAASGDRIRLADDLDGVRRFVLRSLVPAVSGATIADLRPDIVMWAADAVVERLRPIIASLPTGRLRSRGAARDAVGALGLGTCRLVLVTGDAGVAVDWLDQIGLRAEPLVTVPGCAAPISAARPFPGVTVAVADDGEVLVRADFVAIDAAGDDGWFHTGRVDA